MKEKIFILTQEINNDGEITFEVFPCSTLDKSKKLLEEKKEWYQKNVVEPSRLEDDQCALAMTPTSYYNSYENGDYYISLDVEEKEII